MAIYEDRNLSRTVSIAMTLVAKSDPKYSVITQLDHVERFTSTQR